jgi:hypothetical protein
LLSGKAVPAQCAEKNSESLNSYSNNKLPSKRNNRRNETQKNIAAQKTKKADRLAGQPRKKYRRYRMVLLSSGLPSRGMEGPAWR